MVITRAVLPCSHLVHLDVVQKGSRKHLKYLGNRWILDTDGEHWGKDAKDLVSLTAWKVNTGQNRKNQKDKMKNK